MKKAFGYLRVSGQGQVDGDGFNRQEKAIMNYTKSNDLEIVKIYREEGVSGTLENRPGLSARVNDLGRRQGRRLRAPLPHRLPRRKPQRPDPNPQG